MLFCWVQMTKVNQLYSISGNKKRMSPYIVIHWCNLYSYIIYVVIYRSLWFCNLQIFFSLLKQTLPQKLPKYAELSQWRTCNFFCHSATPLPPAVLEISGISTMRLQPKNPFRRDFGKFRRGIGKFPFNFKGTWQRRQPHPHSVRGRDLPAHDWRSFRPIRPRASGWPRPYWPRR